MAERRKSYAAAAAPYTAPGNKDSSKPAAETTNESMEAGKKNQLKQYTADNGHFSLVRNFRPADLVTIMNGVCGLSCLFSCARYLVSPPDNKFHLYMGLVYPLLGFGFDVFDGKVARWTGSASMLGQEMDSLADLVSFGVSPAFIAFTLGLRTPLDTLLLSFFVSAGLARLARFNATVALIPSDSKGKINYFEGLPIPSSLALVGYMAWCVYKDTIGEDLPLGVWGQEWTEVHGLSVVFALWGAAMVSKTLRIPKL